jgi:hypothetical protein
MRENKDFSGYVFSFNRMPFLDYVAGGRIHPTKE